MMPIKSLEDVLNNWDVIFRKDWASIYAFLLYTDEDKELAGFVRDNFRSLDELSGNLCLIFLIDEPSKSWKQDAEDRDYWRNFDFHNLGNDLDGFKTSKPYDKSKAYEIAKYFDIQPKDMPCLVFFKDIEDKEVLTYPIENSKSQSDLSILFRGIFSFIGEKVDEVKLKNGLYLTDEKSDKVSEIIWKSIKSYARRTNAKSKIKKISESKPIKTIGGFFKSIFTKYLEGKILG